MTEIFRLKGLNAPWKAGGFDGFYATVEYGAEDWFHSAFDESKVPYDRQKALFNMFKDSEDNLWSGKNHQVKVDFLEYSTAGKPVNPVIVELLIDDL